MPSWEVYVIRQNEFSKQGRKSNQRRESDIHSDTLVLLVGCTEILCPFNTPENLDARRVAWGPCSLVGLSGGLEAWKPGAGVCRPGLEINSRTLMKQLERHCRKRGRTNACTRKKEQEKKNAKERTKKKERERKNEKERTRKKEQERMTQARSLIYNG